RFLCVIKVVDLLDLKTVASRELLMQFLMGLDDVFNSVRSIILTTELIPDVKSAFATLSKDELHRISHSSSKNVKARTFAFGVVYKHYNMIGHTIDRCFKLVGYPPGFKKGNGNQNSYNNVSVVDNKSDHSKGSLHTLTSDQYQRLMNFLSDTCNASTSHVSIVDVLVVPGYKVSLLSVHKLSKDNKVVVSFTDSMCKIQDLTQKLLMGTGSEKGVLNESDKFGSRSPESNEPYDDGGECANISNEFAPNKSTNESRVSTIDNAAREKDNTQPETPISVFDSNSVDVTGSTSKDTRKEKHAIETDVSEGIHEYETETHGSKGIQSTSLNDDDYMFEGEDLESFCHLFGWSPEPAACQTIRRKDITRKWVFKVKYKASGEIKRFKTKLVAKGFNQKEGIDYEETFSLVVKIVTARYLEEDINMNFPEGYSDKNVLEYEVFNRRLRKLKYFMGIEVLDVDNGICLTQRKYCTELHSEFGMLACKPCNTPKEANPENTKVIFICGDDEPLTGITHYQKLVGKLIYLTMTRHDISYAVHCLSQVMHSPMKSHLRLAFRVLRYLKKEHGLGISFKQSNNANLRVFVDSDWAKCKATRSLGLFNVFQPTMEFRGEPRNVTPLSLSENGEQLSQSDSSQSVINSVRDNVNSTINPDVRLEITNVAITDCGEKSNYMKRSRKRKIDSLTMEAVEKYVGKPIDEAAMSLAGKSSSTLDFWLFGFDFQCPPALPSLSDSAFVLRELRENNTTKSLHLKQRELALETIIESHRDADDTIPAAKLSKLMRLHGLPFSLSL
nr:ribonuclease H-like domain-containing protein [Tanacetum cinerariifolium]